MEKIKIDIGSGDNPKKDFKGVDLCKSADYKVDLETENLPFENESVSAVFTTAHF